LAIKSPYARSLRTGKAEWPAELTNTNTAEQWARNTRKRKNNIEADN